MGEVAMLRGGFQRALTLFDESISHGLAVNYVDGLGIIRKADAKLHQGDPEQAATLCMQALKLDIENGGTTPFASLALAGAVSAGRGELIRAAQLLGAVEALLESYHAHLLPFDQHEFDLNAAAVRAQLDGSTLNAAWAEGRAMTLEQAIVLAYDGPDGYPSR